MARRQRSSNRQHAPLIPKPIVIAAPVINVAGLVEAYNWFPVSKQIGFKLAFEWYSKNVPALLFGDPLDEARQKQYDRATKSKNLGDSSGFPEEKLTSWTTAVHLYEKCWSARSLPKLDEHIDKTDLSEGVKAVQTVLTSLNMAFTGLVTFRMTFNSEREFDGTEVLIPQVELKNMIPLSPLKIALMEAPTVAKVVSIVTDDEGNQSLDGEKFMSNLPLLLTNVATWAESDRVNIKAIGKAAKTARTSQTSRMPTNYGPKATPKQMSELWSALKTYLMSLGSDVQATEKSQYTAFQKGKRNFTCAKASSKNILVWVKVNPSSISLESGFTRDARNGHPPAPLEITLRTDADLQKALPLIQQSYMN